LCEGVQPPKGELEHIHYFCGNTEIQSDLEAREPNRTELYKAIATFVRCYASIAGELTSAGYTEAEAKRFAQLVEYYIRLRDVIRRASGEELDLKTYEADMRYLIDTYIEAKDSVKIMDFGGVGLLKLIDKLGIEKAMETQPEGLRGGRAAAETIGNNLRVGIRKSRELDPAFYDKMSQLLDEVLADLREKRIEYAEYLVKVEALAKKLAKGHDSDMPSEMNTQGQRAIFNNIKAGIVSCAAAVADGPLSDSDTVSIVKQIQEAVLSVRQDSWRGNQAKENAIKRELYFILKSEEAVERLFVILKNQGEY
jgi:type I restriction enzyme R subunit